MRTTNLLLICAISVIATASALTPQERELLTGLKGVIAGQKVELSGLATDLAAQKAKTDEAKAKNETSLAALVKAMDTIAGLQRDARIAADAAAQLTAERDGLKDKVAAMVADKKALLASFHSFKLWTGSACAILSAFAVGIVIFRFAAPALNTVPGILLAFGAPAAAGAAVFTFILTR